MRSSYIENHFGELLTEYIRAWQPALCVELGVLDGYSTLAIAKGIEWIYKYRGSGCKLHAYDLFDDYKYKHGDQKEVQKLLDDNGVGHLVELKKGDAYEAQKNYPDVDACTERGIEFLHVDISNTGKVVHDIMELWHPKISGRGLIILEGGSDERDNVEWMVKYNMPSIKKEIETNPIINEFYIYGTYFKFPSMTILLRHWWH